MKLAQLINIVMCTIFKKNFACFRGLGIKSKSFLNLALYHKQSKTTYDQLVVF